MAMDTMGAGQELTVASALATLDKQIEQVACLTAEASAFVCGPEPPNEARLTRESPPGLAGQIESMRGRLECIEDELRTTLRRLVG